ncbi:MAG: ABC transporter ATP-binding protein [bacterium]|nr:ABC transporter ATP-binding protein [bacterium]
MQPQPAVVVDNLKVIRGHRTVLPGLSCTISPGEVTGLLGPSGSGKTTLMRAIVGVQQTHGGTVTVLGQRAGTASLRRSVAYMTQAASVYRDLTVRGNVRYFARLAGATDAAVNEAIDQVGLRSHATHLVGNLSGGQLSRVSLACALVGNPELLVLDEPTVGQDPVLRHELWEGFRERARAGTTILVSSHVMDEAARCDALLLLREGRLIFDGSPPALLTATGTADYDSAFLHLVTEPGPGPSPHQRPTP